MAKTKLNYTVRTVRAPGSSVDTAIPVIVERREPVELQTVIENCIDRGRIASLKPTAAKGIADGIAEQIKWVFEHGQGVAFGQYFYGRPYLSGVVNENGTLSAENSVNIRLYKGNLWKLTRDDFTFSFDGAGDAVTVDTVYGSNDAPGGNTNGQIVSGYPVVVNGRNFYAAGDTNKVVFNEIDGTGHVEVSEFTSQGDQLLVFDWPSGLESGKSYTITVERTDMNGVKRTSAPRSVKVVGEAPAPTPIWESEDGLVKIMSVSDAETGSTFTWGNVWDMLGEGFTGTEPGWFVEIVMLSTAPGAETVNLDFDVNSATEIELTPGAGAELEAGDYPNAMITFGIAHNGDEGLVTESAEIPVHLVVAE